VGKESPLGQTLVLRLNKARRARSERRVLDRVVIRTPKLQLSARLREAARELTGRDEDWSRR